MQYVITLIVISILVLVYIFQVNRSGKSENVLDDSPSININKESLENYAKQISLYYSNTEICNCRKKLIKNLNESYENIVHTYEYIEKGTYSDFDVIPAAEWLLDNLYLIEKEYKDIKHNMPEEYYRKLPVLTKGAMKGYPRIYQIAVELVSHTDGRIDEESIFTFIKAYQENTYLTIGELWAFPIMLRIALIQNISKISEKLVYSIEEKKKADEISEEIVKAFYEKDIENEIQKISEKIDKMSCHFAERLLKVLRDSGIETPGLFKWIDSRLECQETNVEKVISEEHQKQAGYQLSMGNCITSIREVEGLNWRDNFEQLNSTEKILMTDPSNIYPAMDFESRDNYRHCIEKLSKKFGIPESFIAKKAIECARSDKDGTYKAHVGYYLVDKGIEILKKSLKCRNNLLDKFCIWVDRRKVGIYIGSNVILTLLVVTGILALYRAESGSMDTADYIIAFLFCLIPASSITISVVNWSINHFTTPNFLPKLQMKGGIPDECRACVVIPTLLTNKARAHELISDMEVYYLANKENNIYFALLGDYRDSKFEHEKNDEEILKSAESDIKFLNRKYSSDGKDIFFLLMRKRQFNAKEDKWMGWERKRGKLIEFNSLLRGDKNTSYFYSSGDLSEVFKSKYVITLDADTQLPRDTAKKLIGAMSHPLNRIFINDDTNMVERGYGIMQPRVNVGSLSANRTVFTRIFSGEAGIDIYTSAISDVYQDVFKEGIFTGKGIYDVDAFNRILKDEIPENSVLSHDLLEGCYMRTALLTDVQLLDGYPSTYISSSRRLHRWVRGDWQLLPWLGRKYHISLLSKWKIIDNLRRSCIAPSLIILIFVSLCFLKSVDVFAVFAVVSLLCPVIFGFSDMITGSKNKDNFSGKFDGERNMIEQIFLDFCFLPYKSYLMIDAIVRTLYRLLISKKNMLEWETAADVEQKLKNDLRTYITNLSSASIISIVVILLAFNRSSEMGFFFIPTCLIWFLSPYIAYYISMDIKKESKTVLNAADKNILRRISRKIWAYFEDYVSPNDNWLGTDNIQEYPALKTALRTSPTNMAMALMSNITAFDMGYIGMCEMTERLDSILTSMEGLKRYKGHFYNWYNVKTKEPLMPKYISTVDSGNLVGYLWTIERSLLEYLKQPVLSSKLKYGLNDTLKLASSQMKKISSKYKYYEETISQLENTDFDLTSWKKLLLNTWGNYLETRKENSVKSLYWNEKVKKNISKDLKEIQRFFPWCDLIIERPDEYNEITEKLKDMTEDIPLCGLNNELESIANEIELSAKSHQNDEWIKKIVELIRSGEYEIQKIIDRIQNLRKRLKNIAYATDFYILFDKKKQLFSIGYDVEKESLGNSYYDLLASEARQASFVAIAKGDIDQEHWFKLGRSMTYMGRNLKGLVSWSGTMFEYLMPLLIMKRYPNTLLSETYTAVVEGQKKYCKEKKVPWGISESAYASLDINMNYQYKAFGIPGIGLKRGLMDELVVSPYSTVLALMVDLKGGMENLNRLIAGGMEGKYGFYESVDYTTKDRFEKGKKKSIIKCFMIHHEGMSFMSIENVLNNNILQRRFHSVPEVKATEILLQEKVPKSIVFSRNEQFKLNKSSSEKQCILSRTFEKGRFEFPEVNLISNGSYSMMITAGGSGYGKINNISAYRWRDDPTLEDKGMFFYVKNINSNEFWSAAYEPVKTEGDSYKVEFSLDKSEFKRKDGNISTDTEITVSNEDNAEVRRISLTNHSQHSRTVEVTSYMEVTLADYNSDLVHPSFSNLFVETEYVPNPSCIIAKRRIKGESDNELYIMQTTSIDGESVGSVQYETSRANFIGRCRDLSYPQVMNNDAPLKNSIGAVIDPIISIRRRLKIKPGDTCIIAYTTAVCNSREEALELARKYREIPNIDRVFELSWTQTQVEIKYLGIKSAQANLYQMMASRIIFMNEGFREREKYIKNLKEGQSAFWKYGISGDSPIVLLKIWDENDIDFVRSLINAHEYWNLKGLKVDLVILNCQDLAYIQPLFDTIRDMIDSISGRIEKSKFGGIFQLNYSQISKEDRILLFANAKVVLDARKGSIISQIKFGNDDDETTTENVPEEDLHKKAYADKGTFSSINNREISGQLNTEKLVFFNGYGGFDASEKEYRIVLDNKRNTPAPWVNIIANENFGFMVSETGASYTWFKNSRENKLTSWNNDPVMDTPGEAVYIRDDETLDIWSLSPEPVRQENVYEIRHGFGYSKFIHESYGILGEMTTFVPCDDNVKICSIKLTNKTSRLRKVSITYYAELVLGVMHEMSMQHIVTDVNKDMGYICANNPYNDGFRKCYTYLYSTFGKSQTFTGNRMEFLGREGSIKAPIGLTDEELSGTYGAGFDPCMAEMVKIDIPQNSEKEVVFLLGGSDDISEAEKIMEKYSDINEIQKEFSSIRLHWKKLLETIQVKTPDESMNILLNGWLMYQTISCRFISRSAFYQSGGAFGFRDQLQDSMAIEYIDPEITKKHIIRCAGRQYEEGDVQHWWHPEIETGIRTLFSDDLLWLPYVTADYIDTTGDLEILNEMSGYLHDKPLNDGETERYGVSEKSVECGTIYEHCIKAIERSLRFGRHNLPLIGSGDWNDGMNCIGSKGKGESVWLGWFLYSVLDKFSRICRLKKDDARAEKYENIKALLKKNIEKYAWDGSWYRRAYFDDGTPLGSIQNSECQIDSLAQSWSVISGAGNKERSKEAMAAVERYLVEDEKGIILLLTPAFDKADPNPGYIKGYIPGVRENGGQYTHSSIWVVLAEAEMGNKNKAWKFFNMINPINHSRTLLECERYKVEPYVMSADIYAREPHTGRGGWSWYTGAAGWMYRVGIEAILGLQLKGSSGFTINPCIPDNWNEYEIKYKRNECEYIIKIKRGENKGIYLDENKIKDNIIPYLGFGIHNVQVVI